jgi:hypothetical protein
MPGCLCADTVAFIFRAHQIGNALGPDIRAVTQQLEAYGQTLHMF